MTHIYRYVKHTVTGVIGILIRRNRCEKIRASWKYSSYRLNRIDGSHGFSPFNQNCRKGNEWFKSFQECEQFNQKLCEFLEQHFWNIQNSTKTDRVISWHPVNPLYSTNILEILHAFLKYSFCFALENLFTHSICILVVYAQQRLAIEARDI